MNESTLPGNKSVLLSYVRFIDEGKVVKELLFVKIACATDRTPALTGCHKGFLAFLKKTFPNILTMHCVIHRQHLVAKNLNDRFNKSLKIAITCVNKMKSYSFNSRMFKLLRKTNDEDFDRSKVVI